jgi:hypothetical protein
VVATGATEVTMLHAIGMGKLELSPSLEAKSSSLGNSSRMACSDGDPLQVMPSTMALELSLSGDKLKLSKWLLPGLVLFWLVAPLL